MVVANALRVKSVGSMFDCGFFDVTSKNVVILSLGVLSCRDVILACVGSDEKSCNSLLICSSRTTFDNTMNATT